MRNEYNIIFQKRERKKPLGRPRHIWMIILRWILNELSDCDLDLSGSGYGPAAGSCEHGNEHSRSIKGGEFLDYLSDYWLLKKTFAPWSKLFG
jgi:hypothetical protein